MQDTFIFKLYDTDLFGQYWQPEITKKVIVLVHGMVEYASRFEESVIKHLIKNKIAVIAFDQFGHGRTRGKRGHCPSYKALLESVEFVIEKAKKLFPNKPIVLYGHSMGGNLVINYVLRQNHNVIGVIATSPFLRLAFEPPKWKVTLGELLLKIWPSLTLPSELEVEAISRDINEIEKYKNDALVHDKISAMFAFPVIEAGEWAIENANKLDVPMLILHGTGDRITSHKGSEIFSAKTGNASLKLFKDGYHELHHDLCRDEFIETVLNWLNKV
ncbi:lysophospholipase [Yeosuana sp. MJ-SS3]|uniref:Lysophospholipase n=1 Tax=Gilvirhabdus luticola TaxID=3079858 RepID=A0ABU3U7A9_9FLAO|nr:alpha/beta hydrolase [Yeosuana sp. MJ-SS3]MDU8886281.1 lysophospholipase [Yeosuana sp. MJ-SS3]